MIDGGKRNVLGVLVDAVDYEAATGKVLAAAREHRPLALTALAVHGVMTGVQDKAHGARLNAFDVVTPDGQPVRWALNLLHGASLADRVYGPTLTLRVLSVCADEALPVYLYGSTQDTLDRLVPALTARFPALKVAGAEPSKFRSALPGEPAEIAARIKESGRLWKRYLLLNPAYLAGLAAQKTRLWRATPPPPATGPVASFAV